MLRERGGTGLHAAKKAEEVIKRILMRERDNSCRVGRLTRKGELRIKGGIKFDLGSGYRLVCAKKGSHLVLLYMGTHDDCRRWLENNKNLEYRIDDDCNARMETRESASAGHDSAVPIDPADEYEEQLMKRIDDKVLRNIFCGLVEK